LVIGGTQDGLVILANHVSAVETLIWTILRVVTLIQADVFSVCTTRVGTVVNDARTGITEMPLISRAAGLATATQLARSCVTISPDPVCANPMLLVPLVTVAEVVHLDLRVDVDVSFVTVVKLQSHLIVMSTLVSASVAQVSLDASVTNVNRDTGTTAQGDVNAVLACHLVP